MLLSLITWYAGLLIWAPLAFIAVRGNSDQSSTIVAD